MNRRTQAFFVAPEHPLLKRDVVTLADIAGHNLLVRERGSGTRAAIERLYGEKGVPLDEPRSNRLRTPNTESGAKNESVRSGLPGR